MSNKPLIASLEILITCFSCLATKAKAAQLGMEVSIPVHLNDGEEFTIEQNQLLHHGKRLFDANWTWQEGGGRPLTKGTGAPLADPTKPLVFPRNFNRISAPDANSCAGCHNNPVSGGNGDIVANVFVLGQRFDFVTFDESSTIPTSETVDESGKKATLSSIANSRATLGMFGSGFIEMLSRQMTADLQKLRDALSPGDSIELVTKEISFGILGRMADGSWDTSMIDGLPAPSLKIENDSVGPNLIIRPFHQAGNVVSIRQFSNGAFNHHHGVQSSERFGLGQDPDGDGYIDEMTRADITAVSVFQAAMAPPGRVIPNDKEIELAVLNGEVKFTEIGCARCHVPYLALNENGWVFTEPNPYNPEGNLRQGEAPDYNLDLTDAELPLPRLQPIDGVVYVPAFTDLKLHDISASNDDPNIEALNMNQPLGSEGFFGGNREFLTRKLWGASGKPNFFHHGKYTTMRESILAHAGEAMAEQEAFSALPDYDKDSIIEFLKTLKVLPEGTSAVFVDENFQPKEWPPAQFQGITTIPGGQILLQWGGASQLYPQTPTFQVQSKSQLTHDDWANIGEPTQSNKLEVSALGNAGFFRLLRLE